MADEPLKNEEKTEIEKDEKGKFAEGNKGGPGRPKGSAYMEEFKEAIKAVEKRKDKKLFERIIERAFTSDSVMVAVLKKFIPDTMRQEIKSLDNIEIIVRRADDKERD